MLRDSGQDGPDWNPAPDSIVAPGPAFLPSHPLAGVMQRRKERQARFRSLPQVQSIKCHGSLWCIGLWYLRGHDLPAPGGSGGGLFFGFATCLLLDLRWDFLIRRELALLHDLLDVLEI